MFPTTVKEHEYLTYVPYASAVGSLIYAIVCTKARFVKSCLNGQQIHARSWKGHWETVKWILQYMKGTIEFGLVFKKDVTDKQECIRYVNSDYAGDLDKHRSTTKYVFTLS